MIVTLKPGESLIVKAGNETMVIQAYYGLNSDFLEMQPDPEPYEILPWMKPENICLSVRHEIPDNHELNHITFQINRKGGYHRLESSVKEEK